MTTATGSRTLKSYESFSVLIFVLMLLINNTSTNTCYLFVQRCANRFLLLKYAGAGAGSQWPANANAEQIAVAQASQLIKTFCCIPASPKSVYLPNRALFTEVGVCI